MLKINMGEGGGGLVLEKLESQYLLANTNVSAAGRMKC